MQNHFVSYWSLGGFNNRLQALQIALLLSKLLNRTLIVGPFTLGHDKGRETPYTEFLDPIEWPTVNWNSPELQGKLELSKSNTANVNFAWRRNCSVPLPHVVSELESLASVQVLHYPYYSGFWRILFSSEYHEVIGHFFDRSLRLKQALYDEAISISGVLQKPYAVIHFRLGDRYGLPLVNCDTFPVVWFWRLPELVWPKNASSNMGSCQIWMCETNNCRVPSELCDNRDGGGSLGPCFYQPQNKGCLHRHQQT